MTLWNLIRDFFVKNIFGGSASDGTFVLDNILGVFVDKDIGQMDTGYTTSLYVNIGNNVYSESTEFSGSTYLCFADWLSSTFTIITLILLIIFLYIFVKWIFKLFSGLLH